MRSPEITRTPSAERDPLSGALDDGFVNADGTGGEVFEVEIGIVSASRQGLGKVILQIMLRDAEFRGKEGIGEGHDYFQCSNGERNSHAEGRLSTGYSFRLSQQSPPKQQMPE